MARALEELLAEERQIESATRQVSGPAPPSPAAGDCVVVCLVRDGRQYVDGLVDHHLRLGAAHVVFLDNGSTDGTVERLAGRDRVSVFSCDLPYKDHKLAFKRWLLRRFATGGWGLCVDADEHFDYPGSSRLPLGGLLRYLDDHGFDVVQALMLDLFPRAPLRAAWQATGADWRERHRWFDLESIKRHIVEAGGRPVRVFYGGVRAALGVPRANLTKFPLLRPGGAVRFLEEGVHKVPQGSIADVSGLLLHYKFAPCFPARLADALARKQYYAGSAEYVAYDAALRADPELSLWTPGARRYDGADELESAGLVDVSGAYRAWVER